MRCWFVPKKSADSIRKALKRAVETVRPDASMIDTYQHPLGDAWLPLMRPLQRFVEDQHGLEAEAGKINARLQSPFETVRKQGERDAEASWINRTHEAVAAGADPARIEANIPQNARQAAAQAYSYAKLAAKLRLQRDGYAAGLFGPAGSGNHVVLPFKHLEQAPGRFLGTYKGLSDRVAQTLDAYEPKQAATGAEKLGSSLKNIKKTAVGLKMWTPAFHDVTILGRFLPTLLNRRSLVSGAKALTRPWALPAEISRGFQDLQRLRTDPKEAERMGRLGLIQLGPHGYEGKLISQLTSALKTRGVTGQMAHAAIAGWKDSMSWAINNMGIVAFRIAKDDLMSKGIPEKAAEVAAAKRATIIIGTLPEDMMTRGYRKAADWLLFSKRYTTSTWLTLARAMSKDKALASELRMMGFDPKVVEKTLTEHQKAFQALLLKDLALFYGLSNAVNYVVTGMNNMPDKDGKKGAHFIWENPGATWYSTIAKVRFVAGKDPVTGATEYAEMPFRGTRDLAMMLLQLPAWLTGADQFDPGAFQVYANKMSPLVALASMLYSGRDWRGKTLNMPTTPETTANVIGNVADIMQPLPVRDAMVKGATLMSEGQYGEAVIKPWLDMIAEAEPKALAVRSLGIQTSEADPVAAQYYRRQEAWRNWMSDPGIRADLKAGDEAITNAYFSSAKNAGISYSEAASTLARLRQGKVPKALQALEAQ